MAAQKNECKSMASDLLYIKFLLVFFFFFLHYFKKTDLIFLIFRFVTFLDPSFIVLSDSRYITLMEMNKKILWKEA